MDAGRDPLAGAQPGERWVVRRRLTDGSATDVIGWVQRVDAAGVDLSLTPERDEHVERSEIVLARRAPAAAGGPPPSRTTADALEQLAWPAWVADHEPLGEWRLRYGGGFTARANSCLAVGDPGLPIPDAAARVIAYAEERGIPPWVQVITGAPPERELLDLGWRPVHQETDVLAARLTDLLSTGLPDPRSQVSDDPATFLGAYVESRPTEADPQWVEAIVRGNGQRAYGLVVIEGETVTVGRGHLDAGWLGLTALWTRPAHRRRGLATATLLALGHWAARRGARYAYLQVAVENVAARGAYENLGFRQHHRYRYLAAPTTT